MIDARPGQPAARQPAIAAAENSLSNPPSPPNPSSPSLPSGTPTVAARAADVAGGSGPVVGDLFRRVLALIFVIAWLSLGWQVRLLIGAHGLMPLSELLDAARDQAGTGLSFWDFPTVFWWFHSDGALLAGIALGLLLALGALAGVRPRLCFALSTALYLSYATAGRTFLSFQWDNLLLECGMLASFLPAGRAAPLVHFLFRVVLFKLYFESGVAKWQSPLHDWQDGSAMTLYYETAPLPTWLAWRAHNLPLAWHHFESRATLFLELVVPLAVFGPRRARLAAAAMLTVFQAANVATANYGFFCYLAAALHLFLLDDRDLLRARRGLARLGRRIGRRPRAAADTRAAGAPPTWARDGRPRWRWPRARSKLGTAGARLGALGFVLISAVQALFHFTAVGPTLSRLQPVMQLGQTWRLIGTYHLFAAITRERIEPEFQTSDDGGVTWTAQPLWHKAGDPARAPDFVAPHQPRVDFQLWFYGLGYARREPAYVDALIEHLCAEPAAVQPLFRAPLPARPAAVRIAYWRYHFTTAAARRASGNWWRREWIGATRTIPCDR
jgi:hypothetical protein